MTIPFIVLRKRGSRITKKAVLMKNRFGYAGKILHVNLTDSTWRVEINDEDWYRIYAGGGLMGTYFILKETPAGTDPFSPANLLIFLSSVVAGLEAPGLARFSVVTKSPLSNGIAEARCEGGFGRSLKASGYDAIVLHGKASRPVYLVLDGPANGWCGMPVSSPISRSLPPAWGPGP